MSLDDGIEDGDLGLGFGLKPGSLISPEDAQFHFCKRLTEDTQNMVSTCCVIENVEQQAEKNELLNYELDSLRRQLLSKQQAIKILQQQLKCCYIQNEELEKKLKWIQGQIIKDFNFLQFSVERERLVTSESREILITKIDHLEAENKCLKVAIENQREDLISYKYLCLDKNFKKLFSSAEIDVKCLQQNNQDPVECHCPCNEYGKCPCAKYCDRLVRVLQCLNEELKELRNIKIENQENNGGSHEDNFQKTGSQIESDFSLNFCSGGESDSTRVAVASTTLTNPAIDLSPTSVTLPLSDPSFNNLISNFTKNVRNNNLRPNGKICGSPFRHSS